MAARTGDNDMPRMAGTARTLPDSGPPPASKAAPTSHPDSVRETPAGSGLGPQQDPALATTDVVSEEVRAQALFIQVGDQTEVFHAGFTAGRQGDLRISDEEASLQHASFRFAHGVWYVEDLGSTNGTWLNGRRMFSAQRLRKGDKIKIGHTVLTVVSAAKLR